MNHYPYDPHSLSPSLSAPSLSPSLAPSFAPSLPHSQAHTHAHTQAAHAKSLAVAQPHVVFVGNLSYFCEEAHLFELFNEYGHAEHVRIVRNDSNTRSLMFGFVTMASVHEAREMERLLNHHLFMGRRMRVAISERRFDGRMISGNEGVQVHVSFCSFFPEHALRRPTESFLRRVFLDFGTLIDVSVKEYRAYQEQCMQEGYGFITLSSYEDALRVASSFQNLSVDGISLTCSLTHQHNPHSKKHRSPSPQTQYNPHTHTLTHNEGLPPMPPRPMPLSHNGFSQPSHMVAPQNIYPAFAPHSSFSLPLTPSLSSPHSAPALPLHLSQDATQGERHAQELSFAQNTNNASLDSFGSSSGSGRESLTSSVSF